MESIATGLIAGPCRRYRRRRPSRALLRATALGSFCHYVSGADPKHYQPANITFRPSQLEETNASASAATRKPAAPSSAGALDASKSIAMPASRWKPDRLSPAELARAGNLSTPSEPTRPTPQFSAPRRPIAPPAPAGPICLSSANGSPASTATSSAPSPSAANCRRPRTLPLHAPEGVVLLNVARPCALRRRPRNPRGDDCRTDHRLIDGVGGAGLNAFPCAIAPSRAPLRLRSASANSPAQSQTSTVPLAARSRQAGRSARSCSRARRPGAELPAGRPRCAANALSSSITATAPDHLRHQRHRQALRHSPTIRPPPAQLPPPTPPPGRR